MRKVQIARFVFWNYNVGDSKARGGVVVRTIIRSKITFKAAATLFDSLIKTNCFIWRTNVHSDESHCPNYS